MSNDKEETKKLDMKQYYAANKAKMVKQIMTRQKLLKNSDVFIEETRDKIIEELNSGKRKYLQMATLDKYSININPKTLKYFHDKPTLPTREEPTIEEPTIEEPTIAEPTIAEPTIEEPTIEEATIAEATIEEPTIEEPTIEEPTIAEATIEETANDIIMEEPTNEPMTPRTTPTDEPATEPPTPSISNENLDEEQEEWGEGMSASELTLILELREITYEDMTRIQKYLKRKKNKRKIALIREIREKFYF